MSVNAVRFADLPRRGGRLVQPAATGLAPDIGDRGYESLGAGDHEQGDAEQDFLVARKRYIDTAPPMAAIGMAGQLSKLWFTATTVAATPIANHADDSGATETMVTARKPAKTICRVTLLTSSVTPYTTRSSPVIG